MMLVICDRLNAGCISQIRTVSFTAIMFLLLTTNITSSRRLTNSADAHERALVLDHTLLPSQ